MNPVTRDPFNYLTLRDPFRSFFDRNDVGWPFSGDEESNIATSTWMPTVDIKESDEQFTITADIPGVAPNDIEVTMDNNVLSIKGERESESKSEKDGYRRVERAHGSFHRRFSLPDTAHGEEISATGKDGVLEITIPKRAAAQARRIEVGS